MLVSLQADFSHPLRLVLHLADFTDDLRVQALLADEAVLYVVVVEAIHAVVICADIAQGAFFVG